MQSLRDAILPKRDPTARETEAIAEVHELVAEWEAGTMPLEEVRLLTSGKQRWLATRFTPPEHPRFAPLMRCLDALIAEAAEGRATRQGWFAHADLAEMARRTGKPLTVRPFTAGAPPRPPAREWYEEEA